MKKLLTLAALGCILSVHAATSIDDLMIRATSDREYSYSDKAAGFFYGKTATDNFSEYYAGWNIEAHRIFADFAIYADGTQLLRSDARCDAYPNRIVFRHKHNDAKIVVTMSLVDYQKVIYFDIKADKGVERIGISLLGDMISEPTAADGDALLTPRESRGGEVRLATLDGTAVTVDGKIVSAAATSGGFVAVYAPEGQTPALLSNARTSKAEWLTLRRDRMQQLVDRNAVDNNKALAWIILTADELVTQQHGGWGIYAGFPWFTDFWGRDMFISMPGTILCTGQFDVAKNILESFAKYMDVDPKSETYGRVPNRLNLEGILYNTTDGTPRFVMQVYDYLCYTGDKAFVKAIYNKVKIATDAPFAKYVDDYGFLTHADADTWMDAKRQGMRPCSPRGNRASDIQALWYNQLVCAARLATLIGKADDARRWSEAAERLKTNFQRMFIADGVITDHLNADGSRDAQIRPNTMYTYDLVDNADVCRADIRTTWSHLVYPWGVGSLDQMDDAFHPYHEQWHRYHKDDAYHNGTVWLWQNGMAMQRMIEFGQKDKAYRLFQNMNRQALRHGAIGSLSECADAWLRPGQTRSRLTGTFLQSWSNSEQIRVWSQWFLGVRPDMLNSKVVIAPRIPGRIKSLNTAVCIGSDRIGYRYASTNGTDTYTFDWNGKSAITITLDMENLADTDFVVKPGSTLTVRINDNENLYTATVDGTTKALTTSPEKVAQSDVDKKFFKGVDFAEPCYRENLKSMSRYFDPPLDYQSAE